jgi:hypothetical protein
MSPDTTATGGPQEGLRAFARNQDVRWRRQPLATTAADGSLTQYGFIIELHAAHIRPKHPPHPGCDECRDLYVGLAEIANAAIPPALRDTVFEVHPFSPGLSFAASRGMRAEVVLEIDVVHRNGVGPVDECERSCLGKIEAALTRLGARRL